MDSLIKPRISFTWVQFLKSYHLQGQQDLPKCVQLSNCIHQDLVSLAAFLLFLSVFAISVSPLLKSLLLLKPPIKKSLTTQTAGFYIPAPSIPPNHYLDSDKPVR